MKRVALAMVAAGVGSFIVQATTLEVGPTRVYKTLGAAAAAFTSGDEIVLDDGTYTLTADDQLVFATKTIATVRGRSGNRDAVIIDGAAAYRFINMGTDGCLFLRDMTIRNCKVTSGSGAGVWLQARCYGNEIRNCVFRDNSAAAGSGAAIGVVGNQESASLISGCLFEDNTAGCGGAVSVGRNQTAVCQTVVENCIFRRNTSTVAVWHDNGEAGGSALRIYPENNLHAVVVRNCLFEANDCKVTGHASYGPKGGGAVCSQRYGANTFKIVNCTFVKNTCNGTYGAAIGAWGRTACTDGDWGVYNCAFFGNTSGVQTEANISAPEMLNDKIFNCAFDDDVFANVGTGNRTSLGLSDFAFADYEGGDFAIGAGSVLRDHGYETALAGGTDALDVAGDLRRSTFGSTKVIDIGAYEYQACGDAPEHAHDRAHVVMGTGATCMSAGRKDAFYCSQCDAFVSGGTAIAPLGHGACEWKTVTRASLAQTGLREQVCATCGQVVATETAEAVGTAKATEGTSAILAAEAALADAAGRIFVDGSADAATADGSKAHPYKTLNAAFDAAASGNEIVVNHGVYSLSAPLWTDVPLTLRAASGDRDAVIVDAGGTMPILVATNTAGFVLRDITLRNGSAVKTDPDQVGLAGGVTFKCPTTDGASFLVSNIVLTGCAGKTLQGAGLFARVNGNPIRIVDSDFYDNAVDYTLEAGEKDIDKKAHFVVGGGAYLFGCNDAEVVGSLFARNNMKGRAHGGAGLTTQSAGGTVRVDGCCFLDNVGAAGAGLTVEDWDVNSGITTLKLSNSRFERNLSSMDDGRIPDPWNQKQYWGGAVRIQNVLNGCRIEHCVFRGNATPGSNQANGMAGPGGAIGLDKTDDFVISDCLFERNFSGDGGAVAIGERAVTHPEVIERCVFRQNTAATDTFSGGGALSVKKTINGSWKDSTDNLVVRSCLFDDNDGTKKSASVVAGGDSISVYQASTNLVFENCVIRGRTKPEHCLVMIIWADFENYGSPLFRNCCFLGIPRSETAVTEDVIWFQGRNPTDWKFYPASKEADNYVTYSTSEGTAFPAASCFVCDQPGFSNAAVGDFTLNRHSPLVDKGSGTKSAMRGLLDLAGGKRFRGTAPDIGACEWQQIPGLLLLVQ